MNSTNIDNPGLDALQTQLDRRTYHLKTLYDASSDLLGLVDVEEILRHFLLVTSGNFGVVQCFVLIEGPSNEEMEYFVTLGMDDAEASALRLLGTKLLTGWEGEASMLNAQEIEARGCGSEALACAFPFAIDDTCKGLLGLGPKIVGEAYGDEDRDLLTALINHLTVAVKNARSFEQVQRLNLELKAKNIDLDRKVYHLNTLYEVSRDIFGSVDFEAILKNFLLISMGNFGVADGLIISLDAQDGAVTHFHCMGFPETDPIRLKDWGKKRALGSSDDDALPDDVAYALGFSVDPQTQGLLALGVKLTGEAYSDGDHALLSTLVNNLAEALRNAKAFENIQRLNRNLEERNLQLEKALKKVELLESIKSNLSKFVPVTVSRLIEKSPAAALPEGREQDMSVLFLDIQGYTILSEQLSNSALNELVEEYFSVFMDAIHAHNGDVNETAGDGLMVLFVNEDPITNALESARAAADIREKTSLINRERGDGSAPLFINMGINSGIAFLGAAKFNSYTGSRWTYTARGLVVNVAARIGALATDGAIFLSRATSERIKDEFEFRSMGKFDLKNVSRKMELFALTS